MYLYEKESDRGSDKGRVQGTKYENLKLWKS